jgi:hypothetical protein
MELTETQKKALEFAAGTAPVEEVISLIRAAEGVVGNEPTTPVSRTYDDLMYSLAAGDPYTATNLNGWDGIVALFQHGQLTTTQYGQLYDAI